MEYIEQLKESKYFEPIRNINFFDKKIQKLIEASKVIQKKPLDIVCEYGSKSNFMYFVLEGKLAVFIPKNESDLNQQYEILVGIEKCKKQINKDPNAQEVQQQLYKLQAEWLKIQKQFDSELLNNFKKYQINLRPSQQGWDDEFYLEKKKAVNYQTSSLLKKDVCSMKKVGELKRGDCFGEIGAILDKPRTATIISIEKATCLLVSFDKYKEIFSQEQIYELNFRVLNLGQVFQEKSVETEVVAHLATHFQQIQVGNTIYKEGDRIDGLYLIHNGHVEIFKTQKQYFNNQISIVIKGKGSLIGLEDYFEFDSNSYILNKEQAKINNKKNGRNFTAVCKDLNMKIYKIDKDILDYFIEGYSHFKSYILTMAHQKFLEYNTIYEKNVELKKKLSNLTLVQQIPKSSKKISVDISDTNNSLNTSLINGIHYGSTSLERLEELPKEDAPAPKLKTLQSQIEDQILQGYSTSKSKKEKDLNFPEMLRYENSKIKDLKQNYEIYVTRKKRPQRQQNQSYAKYDAFIKNKFDQQFIEAFEKLKMKQNMEKNAKKLSEELQLNELPENKLSLDYIVQQNQLKSLRFIEQRSKKSKTEKSVNNMTEFSKDSFFEENEDQIDLQNKINLEKEESDQTATNPLSNAKNTKLFKYKSMNLIPSFTDVKVNRNQSQKHIFSSIKSQMKTQDTPQGEHKDLTSNLPTERTKFDTDQLSKFQSIQKIEMSHGISIHLLNTDREQSISNQDTIALTKNDDTDNQQYKIFHKELTGENDTRLQGKDQSDTLNQRKIFSQKYSNFQLDQDKSGKKVILRINRNRYQSDQLNSPESKSQNCSLRHLNISENKHLNQDLNSIQSCQPSERKINENLSNKQQNQIYNSNRAKQQSLIDLKVNNNNSSLDQQNIEERQNNHSIQTLDIQNSHGKILNSFQSAQTQSWNSTNFDSQKYSNSPYLPKISNCGNQDQEKQKIISSFNSISSHPQKFNNESCINFKSTENFAIKSPNNQPKIHQNNLDFTTPNKSQVFLQMSSPANTKIRLSVPNVQKQSIQSHQSIDNIHQDEHHNQDQHFNEKLKQAANYQFANKFFFSQQASKRVSLQPQNYYNTILPQKSNRYSQSMVSLDQDNQIHQNQSMVSCNFYNSHLLNNMDDLQNSQSPSRKITLRKIVDSNSIANQIQQSNNLSYSKPTQNLQRIQMREQIMDDIQSKLGFFPSKKKNETFYKDSALKKLNSHELKQSGNISPTSPQRQNNQQQEQNQETIKKLAFAEYANAKNIIQEEDHQTLLNTPSNKQKNNHKILFKSTKSPQFLKKHSEYGDSLAQIYKLSSMVIGTPKKQLNPSQLMLFQKQSKTSNNYISNLFNNKLNQL